MSAWYTAFLLFLMTRIGIDCRFGSLFGGLGTYTRSLVSALLEKKDPWEITLFVKDASEAWLRQLPKHSARLLEAPYNHYSFQEQIQFPNVLQDAACDALLFPHFNAPLSCSTPFVCTVHDLILHQFPNESSFLKRLGYKLTLSQALRRATAVSVVSTYTKEQVAHVYGHRIAEKISVISPGVSAEFVRASEERQLAVRKKYGLPSPFFLYIGNAKEHKNVQELIDAFAEASFDGVELALVTGGPETARLHRREHTRVVPHVAPEDLPALLSAALACVTATKMEGFCLPLLEAMACGTPVIAPAVGPIPEVTGGHAILFDGSKKALTETLKSFLQTQPNGQVLADAEMWSKQYTWHAAAEKTASLLQKTL